MMRLVPVPALRPGMEIAPETRGSKPRRINTVRRKTAGEHGGPSRDGEYLINDDMVAHASHAVLVV